VTRVLGFRFPEAASSDAPAAGTVAKRGFLVTRWQQMQAEIATQLDALCAAIGANLPYEQPDAIRSGVTRALAPVLDGMRNSINAAVDESINAGDGRYAAVGRAVAACRASFAGNELIAALAENSLTSGAAFTAAISGALDEVERRLTA
jgi:hypothetical protein